MLPQSKENNFMFLEKFNTTIYFESQCDRKSSMGVQGFYPHKLFKISEEKA